MLAPMSSLRRQDHLPELFKALAARPGHKSVRSLVSGLLHNGLGAAYTVLDHEVRMPEVRGRADVLFGATVVEL